MIQAIQQLANRFTDDVINSRHYLHAHPELSFQEYETSKFIADQLKQLTIPFKSGIVKTGIVAMIEGKNPSSRVIALRGDMDALPIQEDTGLFFSSKNKGVMHACGHDIHTASLLGCARILNELKDSFEGTIKLIFQPGEELLPGGAKLMIEEGVLENPLVNTMFGQHVFPDLEVGKVGFKSGTYMASADEIYITVKGKGGHAALPHTIIDPIVAASQIIVALQQIVSRNNNPSIPSVLSFGYINGNGATNIIPEQVTIKGTFRTFDEKWREEAHQQIRSIANGIAEGLGAKCDIEIKIGYPFLINDPATTEFAKSCAIAFLGKENVVDLPLRMTAEDFAYFSQQVPSCFYRLGTSNSAKDIGGSLHHPKLRLDDAALTTGMGLMSYIAIQQLLGK